MDALFPLHTLHKLVVCEASKYSTSQTEKRVIHDALKLMQTKCLGRVSAMRRFRMFLYKTADGYKLYLYWIDTERL